METFINSIHFLIKTWERNFGNTYLVNKHSGLTCINNEAKPNEFSLNYKKKKIFHWFLKKITVFTSLKLKLKKKQLNIFNRKLHCSQHPLIGDSIFSMSVDYFTLPYDADSLWQWKTVLIYGHANTLFLTDVQLTFTCIEKISFMSIWTSFWLFFSTYKSVLLDFFWNDSFISPFSQLT